MPDERVDRELLSAYRGGDEQAAETLFVRYYERLVAKTRRSLGMALAKVEDPSDIAQSVFRSVFRRSKEKQIDVDQGEELWPLLAAVAVNKVRSRARHWQRERRDYRRNVERVETFDPLEQGPSPQDILETSELVSGLLEQFSPTRRRILELMLQGYKGREIAEQVGVSERTVYSTRKAAAEVLRKLDKDLPR